MLNIQQLITQYPPHLQGFKRNILREYLQYKILDLIFNTPQASKLAFLGGTALRIVHQTDRFSEDLDFDNFGLSLEEFEAVSIAIKSGLDKEGYTTEIRTVSKKAFRTYIKIPELLYQQDLSGHEQEKILIQFDTYPHKFSYQPNQVILNKFDVFTQINVTPMDIICAQKIVAAFNRKTTKGRDFYDLAFLMSKTKPNFDYLKLKLDIKTHQDLKNYLLEQTQHLDFESLGQDVKPFLFKDADVKKVTLFPQYLHQLLEQT